MLRRAPKFRPLVRSSFDQYRYSASFIFRYRDRTARYCSTFHAHCSAIDCLSCPPGRPSKMSAEPVRIPSPNTNLGTSSLSSDTSSLPIWDRLSTWAAENKAVVYTIAGVAVVVSGAGVAYYLSDSRKGSKEAAVEEKKRLSKKDRRRAKQEKEKEKGQPDVKAAVVESEDQSKP